MPLTGREKFHYNRGGRYTEAGSGQFNDLQKCAVRSYLLTALERSGDLSYIDNEL